MSVERLKQAFAEALDIDVSSINDDLQYDRLRQWDSVAHMALIAAIEQAFDILIDTDDVIDMSSFAKAKEIVARYGVSI